MASSTAHHEPTHRSPSLTAWHPTLLSRPRHHRHHHHVQQHRTSLMRTAAATAAAAVCYPEMSPGKAIHIAGLTGGSEGPHQPNMVAVTARPLLLLVWLLIMSPSQHILALGTSEVRVLQRLQRAIPFRHPFAQRPCAAGQRAPNWRCAQRKDHETSPQEPRDPLGRWPLASSRSTVSQEAHNSCQAAGQQEVGTRAGVDLETPSPQRHLRLIKQAHLYVSISLVRRPFLKHVSSGLHTTALCAMHQEWTGPGERATLADQHHQWLPGAHWPKVRSGEWWTSTFPDPHQQWWQPGPQPLLPVPEVLGP